MSEDDTTIDGMLSRAQLQPREGDTTIRCRIMDTRTCPPVGECPGPCARFESDDSTPWLSWGQCPHCLQVASHHVQCPAFNVEGDTTMSEDDTTFRCRIMDTRTCPVAGGCVGRCARYESVDPTVWTVSAEFRVRTGNAWQASCAGCLPILVRRAHRRGQPLHILRWTGELCQVRDPHPDPRRGVPPEGYSCPHPLTGPCTDATCDHD